MGGGRIDGFVDPEATAIITAALDALMPPDPKDGIEAPRTLSQRRADAFVKMCQRSLGSGAPSSRAKSNVDIVIDSDTATGKTPTDLLHARCDIVGGGILSKAAVERILCDSAAGYAVIGGPPRAISRTRRRKCSTSGVAPVNPALRNGAPCSCATSTASTPDAAPP